MTDAYGAQASTHRGSNLPGLALLAGLAVLLLVAVGWGWTAQRRVANGRRRQRRRPPSARRR